MHFTMQELEAFHAQRSGSGPGSGPGSGFRARDYSPDSVIFPADSNLSIFSSNSASVDRCSFASDSDSQHLAGHESASSGGPCVDPDPHTIRVGNKNSLHPIRSQKSKVQEAVENIEADTEEDDPSIPDSARNSFSQALKDCQDRRSRPDAVRKKANRQRPASLDFNNAVSNPASSSSPRLGILKKASTANHRTNTFHSPGTPNYRQTSVGMQKGWSSERVPLPNNGSRRQASSNTLVPYNNGRPLPSKWEDAERWILSPVSGDAAVKHSVQQPQRKPKSKSGPLGPPGVAYHNMYSPAVPSYEARNVENNAASSPFSAGVMVADGLSFQSKGAGNFPAFSERCMARSVSVHGCSELISQSSLPVFRDEKLDGINHFDNNVSRTISRRDMATQMSPGSSQHSSPRFNSLFSASNSILPIVEVQNEHTTKPELRDVQVDEQVTMTRWSKKNRARKGSGNSDDWKKKAVEIRTSGWDVSETSKAISKLKREEAKITAWENLQKAKAEAAIRKLEMKLEKKRSSSMDRIMNKLRSAQKKAQEMRSSVLSNQSSNQVTRTSSNKAISFPKSRHIVSFSSCFTCHAF